MFYYRSFTKKNVDIFFFYIYHCLLEFGTQKNPIEFKKTLLKISILVLKMIKLSFRFGSGFKIFLGF